VPTPRNEQPYLSSCGASARSLIFSLFFIAFHHYLFLFFVSLSLCDKTGEELLTLEGHRNVVYAIAFNNPYGDKVITGSFGEAE
jgi:hypothetical protein